MYVRFIIASLTFFNICVGGDTLFSTTCALCVLRCILVGKYFLRAMLTSLISHESIGYVQIYLLLCIDTIDDGILAFHFVDCVTAFRACGSSTWEVVMWTLLACDYGEATGRPARECFSTYEMC